MKRDDDGLLAQGPHVGSELSIQELSDGSALLGGISLSLGQKALLRLEGIDEHGDAEIVEGRHGCGRLMMMMLKRCVMG
jgi:hypothetical protein